MRFDLDRVRKIPGSVWASPRQRLASLSLQGQASAVFVGREESLATLGRLCLGSQDPEFCLRTGRETTKVADHFLGKAQGGRRPLVPPFRSLQTAARMGDGDIDLL